MSMYEEELKFVDGKLYVYTPIPQYGDGICKTQLVMTKEIFQKCYEKWIKPEVQIVCKSCSKEEKSDLISRQELLNDIDKAIETIIQYDAYSVEMRNGMRFVKSLIANEKPEYE